MPEDNQDFKNKPNFQKTENTNPMRQKFKNKQQGMPPGGFPYPNPFMGPNSAMNPMFKKKFPNNMNKKMMMPPQFNP